MISCVLCASVKVTGFSWAEKIPSEYWDNRILKTRFCSWFFQVAKKLINQFLLFQYSCLYITAKKRNSWTFYTSLEKVWSAVYCVQVWKLQFFHRPWKFLLNIDSIEFCYKFTNKDSSWSSKAQLQVSIFSIFMYLYLLEKEEFLEHS